MSPDPWGEDTSDLGEMLNKAAEAARAGDPEPARRFREELRRRFPKRSQPVTNWTESVDRMFLIIGLAAVVLVIAVVIGLLVWIL